MKRFLLLALIVGLMAMGCTTFKASGLAVLPASETHTSLGEFHTTASVTQWLGSAGGLKLANVTADATEGPVAEAIQAAIKEKGGTGAVNITIINQPTLINLLLNYITGSIYSPTTIVISGTVIK